MPIIATCEKCQHRIVIEDMEALPTRCKQPECQCPFFHLKRILTPPYKLTVDDRRFLKAIRVSQDTI